MGICWSLRRAQSPLPSLPPIPRNSSPGGPPVSVPEAGQSAFLWPEDYAEGEFQDLLLAWLTTEARPFSYLHLSVGTSAFIKVPLDLPFLFPQLISHS